MQSKKESVRTGPRAGTWAVAFVGSKETDELLKDRGQKAGRESPSVTGHLE